jgi:hypothetical protein
MTYKEAKRQASLALKEIIEAARKYARAEEIFMQQLDAEGLSGKSKEKRKHKDVQDSE